MAITETFRDPSKRAHVTDDRFSRDEVRLANRNHGAMLELLRADVTPVGAHYLLNHFDVPLLDAGSHRLAFTGAFERPFEMTMDDIRALPQVTRAVTLECSGNGRANGLSPRAASMPWMCEAVGNSEWTGTPLWPLIERAGPRADVVELSFTGADEGFDQGHRHAFGRSMTLQDLRDLDVMLVWGMNGAPLLPQHGAPLRIVVPGWYGMASVKWLTEIAALTEPYTGFQQLQTYHYTQHADDPGEPVTEMRVKSLMVPPGLPDWYSRRRWLPAGPVEVMGRAWSGAGAAITGVELGVGDDWHAAQVTPGSGPYAWSSWRVTWDAPAGEHVLRCRATDAAGNTQPLDPPWDRAGFGNNSCQRVEVFVEG